MSMVVTLRRIAKLASTLQGEIVDLLDQQEREPPKASAMATPTRKRTAAPRPDAAVIAEREGLWSRYDKLKTAGQRGKVKVRATKLAFALNHCGVNPEEFIRWFSLTDKRGIPNGSKPDKRFRWELTKAISELESHVLNSHGRMQHSQVSNADAGVTSKT